MIHLAIVIPCFNEEEVLPETANRLSALLSDLHARGKVSSESSMYFVDDGSRDRTWPLIETLCLTDKFVNGIKLSHNRGHQNALLAGLMSVPGDVIISVDADLQDDLRAIESMLDAHHKGSDIVFGVRGSRSTDSLFKRFTAEGYYRLLAAVGVEVVFNHADYRLMSRSAVEALRDYREVNLFLRGIIPHLGFRTSIVHYDRGERFAGESKYPVSKMLALAIQGITSFSAAPLRIITTMGLIVSFGSFAVTLWAIWVRLTYDSAAVPGWASTVIPMYFLGGVQLLALGVIGEYVAKTYIETKGRPRYIIEKTTFADELTKQHAGPINA